MRDVPERHAPGMALSRRQFVAGSGAAAVGAAALSLPAGKAEAATPQHGGSIKVGLRSDVSRLDPHPLFPPYPTSNAVALLYNGITEVDANANIVPALAHAWEVSDDGLTWTWHIRKDVTFHSGRPMTGAARQGQRRADTQSQNRSDHSRRAGHHRPPGPARRLHPAHDPQVPVLPAPLGAVQPLAAHSRPANL